MGQVKEEGITNGWDALVVIVRVLGFVLLCFIIASCEVAKTGNTLW